MVIIAIYTLSLHDALPIYRQLVFDFFQFSVLLFRPLVFRERGVQVIDHHLFKCKQKEVFESLLLHHLTEGIPELLIRSEEHTSELQSRGHLVCRLLLEKKKSLIIIV